MELTMQLVLVPGTPVSGIDVSAKPRSWRHDRPFPAFDVFPTVNGTGVSAGGCRT
jgi:hypothetical protein